MTKYSVVGENGPEVVRLPGGSHVFPNGQGPSGGGGGGVQKVLPGRWVNRAEDGTITVTDEPACGSSAPTNEGETK